MFHRNMRTEMSPIHVFILSTRHFNDYLPCSMSALELKIIVAHGAMAGWAWSGDHAGSSAGPLRGPVTTPLLSIPSSGWLCHCDG